MSKNYFEEIEKHLVEDDKPSKYLNTISESAVYDIYPLSMLWDLKKTQQSPVHHPEGTVWNHTMLVVDEAAKRREYSEDRRAFMWAALLHDIGKSPTTRIRKGKITSYDHDKVGKEMAEKFLKEFEVEEDMATKVTGLVRWHMQPLFVTKGLPFADIDSMLREVRLSEIARLSECDRLGRGGMNKLKEKEEIESVERFVKICKSKMS